MQISDTAPEKKGFHPTQSKSLVETQSDLKVHPASPETDEKYSALPATFLGPKVEGTITDAGEAAAFMIDGSRRLLGPHDSIRKPSYGEKVALTGPNNKHGAEAKDLPPHLQKLVLNFCRDNKVNSEIGPCTKKLGSATIEKTEQGKPIAFVHGRTGENLEARKCRIRGGYFALVVEGGGLTQASIIRSLPRSTGVGGITAWMVWNGLSGVDRRFLVFKLFGTSFTNPDGKKRKELVKLQNNFKQQKKDPFVRVKPKATRKKSSNPGASSKSFGAPSQTNILQHSQSKTTQASLSANAIDKAVGSGNDDASDGHARQLVDRPKRRDSLGDLVKDEKDVEMHSDIEEQPMDEGILQPSSDTMLRQDNSASAPATITIPHPNENPMSNEMRNNTILSFLESSGEIKRRRRVGTCDTIGKLFLQAELAGIVRKDDDEAALTLTVEDLKLVVPNNDNESFQELVTALSGRVCWKDGQQKASCVVNVERYV
jgi:hypothetical protein